MRVITVNVNGIRAAMRAGFYDWIKTQNADFICLQEVKAQQHQLTASVFQIPGYKSYFVDAEKKGYSGVAIYSKRQPDKIHTQLNFPLSDSEGRFVQLDFSNFSVISVYMPSGTSGAERQACKFQFMAEFEKYLRSWKQQPREFIICGDWNIAHKQIDLKNWRSNQKNSGFLPEERAWLDLVFDGLGFVDVFRTLNQEPEQYTWWSHRGQAYAKNVGWRIDYQVVTPGLREHIQKVAIYKEQKFSDHAPLIVDYGFSTVD